MRLQPVRTYPQPKLPTADVVESNPELLKLLPRRWQTNPAVMAAMVGAGLLLQSNGSLGAEKCAPLAGAPMPPRCVLSESEARSIIIEEAKKAGIVFAADKKALAVPVTSLAAAPIKGDEASDAKLRVTLDGTDAKRGVSYEYVSDADTKAVSKRIGGVATVSSVTEALTAEGKKQLKGRVLTVPAVQAYSKAEADKQLRARVKDFIKWLKGQGVI